jgi:hypothetical protein
VQGSILDKNIEDPLLRLTDGEVTLSSSSTGDLKQLIDHIVQEEYHHQKKKSYSKNSNDKINY